MLRTPQRRGMLSRSLPLSHARYAGSLAVSQRAVALSAHVPGTAAALWPCLQTRSTAAIAHTEIDPIQAAGAFLAFKFAKPLSDLEIQWGERSRPRLLFRAISHHWLQQACDRDDLPTEARDLSLKKHGRILGTQPDTNTRLLPCALPCDADIELLKRVRGAPARFHLPQKPPKEADEEPLFFGCLLQDASTTRDMLIHVQDTGLTEFDTSGISVKSQKPREAPPFQLRHVGFTDAEVQRHPLVGVPSECVRAFTMRSPLASGISIS